MEHTITFVLGVLFVLAIAGVYNMFKTRGQVKDLYEEIEDLQKVINELELDLTTTGDSLNRRIDQEIERMNQIEDKLYKYTDSRTDKIESRLENNIAKLVADIYIDMEAKFDNIKK